MSNISISFNIKETEANLVYTILNVLKPEVDKYFRDIVTAVQPKIIQLVTDAIIRAPEYDSLLNGRLKAEFGLPDSGSRVDTIISFWQKIEVVYKKMSIIGDKLQGGFALQMIPSDFNDVINLPEATLITEKGTDLNWLEWLLLFGNQTIIKDYTVKMGPNTRSRTGLAIMTGAIAGKWGVPSEFAGVQSNNWITRAIDSVDSEIESAFLSAM